jgi:uncharacterized protein YbjT (DUF2867 family)
MAPTIKNVIVIGASGSVGPSIVSALLTAKFNVSVLSRESSIATFPNGVEVHRSDYTESSLLSAFQGQDAIVSTIATFSTHLQTSIIATAVKAGVKRFVPSEYGIDTSLPTIPNFVPPATPKQDTIQCLKSYESAGLSWTGICVGAFFDWAFKYPGLMGWNLPGRKATIFDGGDVEYEATNIAQIGRAVAAVLAVEHYEETKNRYVYVNSFTLTQNKVLEALERLTGTKFEVEHMNASDFTEVGLEKLKVGAMVPQGGSEYADGSVETITAAIYGNGGFNNFSRTRGLWNKKLGLPDDDFGETIERIAKG